MVCGPGHESNHRAVGIDEAVGRAETAAHNVIGAKLRKHISDLLRRNEPYILESHGDLLLIVRAQIGEMFLVGCAEQVTLGPVVSGISEAVVETGIKGDGIERHLNIDWSGELGPHAAHALARGTFALRGFALDHQHVITTCRGQVVGNA